MKRALLALAILPLAVMACGDDDDDAADDGPTVPAASVGTAADTQQIVEVTATDYKFTGLPATAPAGTQFALQNDSTKEVHEMVVIRLPDEVKETVGQILAMTEEEQDALVGDIEPTTVIVALPGEEGMPVEGDGVITEPGRYAVMCFIPVGADVEKVREAMEAPPGTGPENTGQPDIGNGPPHITKGMYAEIVIEE
jgi:hypothetical protein